ncbi:hypothetical protein BKA56DRAFT_605208 [Ilyonectria sp. MPI-CAGE-AT-0026]|nr:hypothetical protein BKA56DRAFT_605208 [Ilyonectria sp. MPI-CAGE-AT-0026]
MEKKKVLSQRSAALPPSQPPSHSEAGLFSTRPLLWTVACLYKSDTSPRYSRYETAYGC